MKITRKKIPFSRNCVTTLVVTCLLCSLQLKFTCTTAFATSSLSSTKIVPGAGRIRTFPLRERHATRQSRSQSLLYAKKQSSPQQRQPMAEFELQELRAQFNAMLEQKVRPKMLTRDKRSEINSYLSKVLQTRESPIPLKSLGSNNAIALHGFWTMVFSTGGDDEMDALGNLPRDCTVQMKISPNYEADYILSFAKTLGLKSLTAKSTYMVDSSPVNPGLVTFVYKEILSDVFGFKALPVGLFGMLQGRATYVDTVWFDGRLWVERAYSPDGTEFYNVYIRSEEED